MISALSHDQFIAKPSPEIWSIAEEFDHVIKSASALYSGLKVSPFILKWEFGKPNRPMRSYDEVMSRYTEKIATVNGKALAPSPFRAEEGKVFDKQDMLNHWASMGVKFEKRMNKWSDKNLDKVLLTHPLLGKMMVRELLYFTHFHTNHHLTSLKKKVSS